MAEGWISIHRKLIHNDIWTEKPFSAGQAWIDLLFRANHKDVKIFGKTQLVKRGSFITSVLKLSDYWGWSRHKVSDFLNKLESEKMITQVRTSKHTTITLTNYDFYQELGHKKDIKRTTEGHQKDTNNNENNENKYIYLLEKNIFEKFENQKIDEEADIVLEEKHFRQLQAKCTALLRKEEFVYEVMQEYFNDAYGKFRTSSEHCSRIMKFMQNKHLGIFDPKKQVKSGYRGESNYDKPKTAESTNTNNGSAKKSGFTLDPNK